ncbi:MAG: hypothetical protein SV375_08075 [Thermodesulfobacteriota bacterium]|nr:hypothetical protein [Thermodesulfobacteriota bacterium]
MPGLGMGYIVVYYARIMGRPVRIQYPGALYHITSRGNERRDILLGNDDRLMKRYACLDNKEIEYIGGLHYSAVSKAAARLEKELSRDKDLAKLVKKLISNAKA